MKNKLKKSPYATLSAKKITVEKKSKEPIKATRTDGGDLRVKGEFSNGN